MPGGITWNAEADARLFVAVLETFDLRFGRVKLQELNEKMGLDAKSQAITHRISALRKTASANAPSNGSTPATPIKPCKANTGRKKKTEADGDEDVSPSKKRRGRGRPPKVKSEEEVNGSDDQNGSNDMDGENDDEPSPKKFKMEEEEAVEGYVDEYFAAAMDDQSRLEVDGATEV